MYVMLHMGRQSNNCIYETTPLHMNSDSLVIKQKQKQTNNKIYMEIEFQNSIVTQNSIVRLSFLCRITDIKIAWINPC